MKSVSKVLTRPLSGLIGPLVSKSHRKAISTFKNMFECPLLLTGNPVGSSGSISTPDIGSTTGVSPASTFAGMVRCH